MKISCWKTHVHFLFPVRALPHECIAFCQRRLKLHFWARLCNFLTGCQLKHTFWRPSKLEKDVRQCGHTVNGLRFVPQILLCLVDFQSFSKSHGPTSEAGFETSKVPVFHYLSTKLWCNISINISHNIFVHSFVSKFSLKLHIQSKHDGIGYVCGECDLKTTQRPYLKIHMAWWS